MAKPGLYYVPVPDWSAGHNCVGADSARPQFLDFEPDFATTESGEIIRIERYVPISRTNMDLLEVPGDIARLLTLNVPASPALKL
jgi:hypothetical protein